MTPNDPHATALTEVDYDPFAVSLTRVVPSTEAQREIWLAAKLSVEASLAYNESVALRLQGALDQGALRTALQSLVDRHDALRATFGPDGETFCVFDSLPLAWHETDLASLDRHARDAAMAERLRLAVETPFDLEQGPLFRCELVGCGADDHTLLLTAHHIICDGWSWWVIVRELATLFAERVGGEHAPLPPADSFADFALAQAGQADRRAHAIDEAYWLSRYAGSLPVLDLPTDRPRPAQRTFASERVDHVFDAALMTAVKSVGAPRGASVFATLLGAFAATLARIAGHTDVVVGIPAAAQAIDGHDHLVGHGVNLLPLHFVPDPAAAFTQLLDTSVNTLLDALEHQQCTFGSLLKKVSVQRDPSRLPLVSVLFNIDQTLDHETAAFPGLAMTFASTARRHENFELSINAVQECGHLRLECQYNRDLFDAVTVRRWLVAYETFLRAAVAQPQCALGALPLVNAAGQTELQALQPAATPFDADQRAHEDFEAQCDRAPGRVAVQAGDTTLTYAELESRANRIAHCLRAHGIHRGALVGIALDRDADMLAAVLGVLKSGAGYVPLDPAFPSERLAYMVGDAGLAALLTQDEHAARFDLRGRPVLVLDQLDEKLAALPATRIGRDVSAATPDSVAYVIYTSGSTGQPKGVLVPHRATANFFAAMRRAPGLVADDRLVAVTTLSFDIAFMELLLPLSVGARVIVASREQVRDGVALRALIETCAATVLQATPSGWRLLLESGWQGHRGFKAISGGEPMALNLAEALLARCGEVWNGYGPTEATVYATFWKVQNPRDGVVIGRPVANTCVWIRDEQGQLCPIGVPGELWIGGPSVASGYLNRPQLTAERFVADPYAEPVDARLYRTGDRGRWLANGNIEHLGRVDFQIKLRGYRIEPGEIEAHLLARSEIAHALVLVREDRPGDARLVAYLVAKPAAVDESVIRGELRALLPDYMVPQHFVILDAIPLLPNGKLDRGRLPAPQELRDVVTDTGVAPRNELERKTAAAMNAVLGSATLGVDDNFFEHGGHSLLAAQVIARLNRELDIHLSLAALFQAPTVARLAATIRALDSTDSAPRSLPAIPMLADRQRAPLSLLQQRMLYLEQLHVGRTVYHAPSAHRLHGRIDESAFERALQQVVQRQAVLRTSIDLESDEPSQQIHGALDIRLLPVEDLSHITAAQREAELMQRMERLIDEPFDLSRAPLFRCRLYRLAAEEHVFFFLTHHIVWDGWSFDLLYDEMAAIYGAFQRGEPSPLVPLPVQYGDFAAWHRGWMQGDELTRRIVHWKQHLRGDLEPLDMPTDRLRPAQMSGTGATEWIQLSRATTQAIRELGQRVDATMFMVLIGAYYLLLHRHSGQRDLVVGTPVRGREVPELEAVMGYFVNMLPLRMELDPQQSFIDFMRQVRDVVIDAFSYPEVPFNQLVKELQIRRDISHPVLYQATFSFQDVRQRPRRWGNLEHENLPVFQHGAADDVGLWFLEHAQGLSGGFTYSVDIFDAKTAARLCERYVTLIESALTDPLQTLAQLDFLPNGEQTLLRQWNATALTVADKTVHGLIEAQVRRSPDRIALRCEEQSCSYVELDKRANQIAHALRRLGAKRGALVGIALSRGIDMVAAVLGVLKTGAGYVPLDPAFPRERLHFMFRDAGLAVMLTERRWLDRFEIDEFPLLLLDDPVAVDSMPVTSAVIEEDLEAEDSVAYVIYTSGSTGKPKGVEISHSAVVNFLTSMIERPGLRADDRLVAVTTLSFDIAVLELFGPLCIGAEVVLARREDAMDGETLKALLASSRATVMQATPATWMVLLQAGWSGDVGFRALCGGEAMAVELATQLLACCEEVWNLYGPTETTVWSTCWRVDQPQDGISIGTPIANTSVWILDEQRQLCPIGVPGEIWIGGAGVALCYRDRPELTAERFIADPYRGVPDARMYGTGDRGRWLDNGTLEHLGRLDFQVKLRGFRIELGEVEAVARTEPAVGDCVAVAHDFSLQDRRLVLYVATNEAEDTLLPRLRSRLAAQLPGYMQPQHVVLLSTLPQTPNGKVDRKSLPTPVLIASTGSEQAKAARIADPRQRYLAKVWCELIGIDEVRPRDNFLDVGGHSLLAVEMAARVRRETGARLNLLEIATGTLASLAMELPESGDSVGDGSASKAGSLGVRLRRLLGFGGYDHD